MRRGSVFSENRGLRFYPAETAMQENIVEWPIKGEQRHGACALHDAFVRIEDVVMAAPIRS